MSLNPYLAKGAPSAWHELALSHAPHVFYLCRLLTAEENTARPLALQAIRKGLKNLKEGKLDQDSLGKQLQKQAVTLCRDALKQKDAASLSPNKCTAAPVTGSPLSAFASLPPFQRFLLALPALCGYSAKQTGELLHLPASAVETHQKAVRELWSEEEALKKEQKSYRLSATEESDVLAIADEVRKSLWEMEQKRKKKLLATSCTLVLAALLCVGLIFGLGSLITTGFTGSSGSPGSSGNPPNLKGIYTEVTVDVNKTYYADIKIRDYGTVTVKLDPKTAPVTVSRFTQLAKEGFYDGLTFHRIMEGFMMQGGDPNGIGSGGSGVNILGEFSANGIKNELKHTRGVISMARATPYNSADSQFFLMHKDAPHLDGKYAAFGMITEGIEIVDRICEEAEPTDNNGSILKSEQPVMESVTIREE